MPKSVLLILALFVIILTSIVTVLLSSLGQISTPKSEVDSAVNQAQLLYRQKRERGENFSNGPCLSDALMRGWVADVVNNPRLPIDDLPENQCPSYREGRSRHFVELDMEGNLVRAK
ncbi:hypothetical protein HYU93_00835 [Candidatus Daviesbacteria bacterium]|nr:hypothetical protein [Candidatus Daviesbacteria bacterium]